MNNKIGIMSGRLSQPINQAIQTFPKETWKDEFEKANKIGFEKIEWIFDYQKNPIMEDDGVKEIKKYSEKYDIEINSICADYFMEKKLFAESSIDLENNLQMLKKLIEQCHKLGISIIEIPLVDSSTIDLEKNEQEFKHNIESILSTAKNHNMMICLETDLEPDRFLRLLMDINHPNVKINYDIGNSTSNGYDPEIELSLLKSWIMNIHVKDRLNYGNTVPLGNGNVDFGQFFSLIKKINYSYDLIIQGAREDLIDISILPEETCSKYFKFVMQYLDK